MPPSTPHPGISTPRCPRPPASGPPDRATRLLVIWTCSALALLVTAWMTGCVLDVAGTATSVVGNGGSGGAVAVDCDGPEDCPGNTTACRRPNCVNNTCGTYYEPAGTACADEGGQVCDGQGNCSGCTEDEHCAPDQVCQDYRCVPRTCLDQVLSGNESDVDCGGDCAPCANGLQCQLYSDCVSRYCVGAGGGDEFGVCTPCDTDDHCLPAVDSWCDESQDDGVCAEKKPPGEPCDGANECLDGNCPVQDGTCCDQPCEATCEACIEGKTGQPTGTCAFVSNGEDPDTECAGTDPTTCGVAGLGCTGTSTACILFGNGDECAPASCAGGVATAATFCDGSGTCNQGGGTTACGDYLCTGTICGTGCGDDSQCVNSAYCDGGSCYPDRPNGQSCSAASWCQSAHCAPDDGICCSSDCTGLCESCDGSKNGGSNGNCVAIPGGNDPDNECTDSGVSCDTNGDCDGNGACATYACNCNQQYSHGAILEYCSQSPSQCVLRANLSSASCNTICAAGGGSCLGAYNDSPNGTCGYGNSTPCNDMSYGSALCVCDR